MQYCSLFYILHFVLMLFEVYVCSVLFFFFFKQKTAYEMRISDWSSDVCSSDLSFPASMRHSNAGQPILKAPRRSGVTASSTSAMCWRRCRQQIGRASCRERVCQYV